MSAPFQNLYTHRKVAETSSKPCDICNKMTTSVLITTDSKDFFYACPGHLKHKQFCTPKIDEAAKKAKLEKKREKKLAEETEKVKKEYEEKQRKKKEKAEKDAKDKDKDKDKDKSKDKKDDDGSEKKKSDSKSDENDDDEDESSAEEEPRVFELKPSFYQQRLQRKRQAEAAKRDRERVSQPGYFPSVPTAPPGK